MRADHEQLRMNRGCQQGITGGAINDLLGDAHAGMFLFGPGELPLEVPFYPRWAARGLRPASPCTHRQHPGIVKLSFLKGVRANLLTLA